MPGNPGDIKIEDIDSYSKAPNRVILHCDLNNFYASVECLHRPDLKGYPVAVGGSEEKRHGIILAKNQLAKSFGVKTAEPIWQAKAKCPNLVIVPPNMDMYVEYSKLVRDVYLRHTDCIEPFGIDECWLDITASTKLFGDGVTQANNLRKTIRDELGLTISVGVSWNKIFSKLGSDMKKPDATTLITKENFKVLVWPLPIEDLLFVGKKTAGSLRKFGVTTIGKLAMLDEDFLDKRFGKWGKTLWAYANGLDISPVQKDWENIAAKGIGNSTTLPKDLYTYEDAKACLLELSESVATRMRKSKVRGRTISISLKTSDLKYFERQQSVDIPTSLSVEILDIAYSLLLSNWNPKKNLPLRAIGVRVTNFECEDYPCQLTFFDGDNSKEKGYKLEETIDQLRDKYGTKSVFKALTIKNKSDFKD